MIAKKIIHKFVFIFVVVSFCSTKSVNAIQCGVDGYNYVNVWVVELHENLETSEILSIVEPHGFIHHGEIVPDTNLHELSHPELEECSNKSAVSHTDLLHRHPKIKHAKQQMARLREIDFAQSSERSTFSFIDPLWNSSWNLNRGSTSDGYDMNVIPAWRSGFTGRGVVVSVIDTGVQTNHPDLAPNYDSAASRDVITRDDDPNPPVFGYSIDHGTKCAGIIASAANNSYCGVGVAYNSKIGGIRLLTGGGQLYTYDSRDARALSFNRDYIDIYSSSWSPAGSNVVGGPDEAAARAIHEGVTKGRRGKGNIYVFSTGNGGPSDDCSCNGYASSMYTISVTGALESNQPPDYMETCPSTMVTAYTGASLSSLRKIVTTDLRGQCSSSFTGTSASAPQAAGIIALTLEANPNLTWRDVQHLIVFTANPVPLLSSGDFHTNAAGRPVSHKFGFGLMDGEGMVQAALRWRHVTPQLNFRSRKQTPAVRLSSSAGSVYSQNITVPWCPVHFKGCAHYIEHVQLILTVSATRRGAISIVLRSPSGTNSTLLKQRSGDYSSAGFADWAFTSVHYWGENPSGNWTFFITTNGRSGVLDSYQLVLYGVGVNPFQLRNITVPNITCHGTCDTLSGCTGPDATQCIQCNSTLYRVEDDRTCVYQCGAGYFADNVTGQGQCKRCDRSCASCSDSGGSSCTSCTDGAYLDLRYNSCLVVCPSGFYGDSGNNTCLQCRAHCSRCTSLSNCISCEDGYDIVHQECSLPCGESEYRNENGTCSTCGVEDCLTCTNVTDCLACRSNTTMYNHHCISDCPSNTFTQLHVRGKETETSSQIECIDCHENCTTCYGSAEDNCLSCQEGYEVSYSHRCIQNITCPAGQFRELSFGHCEACHDSFSSCSGGSELECIACKPGLFMFDGLCVTTCEERYYNHTDPTNTESSCQPCDASCLTCDGPAVNQCSSCIDRSDRLFDGQCIAPCPSGQYRPISLVDSISGNLSCQNCSSECSHCRRQSECTSCAQGLALMPDGRCVEKCQQGFYTYQNTSVVDHVICLRCNQLCETCSGPSATHCLTCDRSRVVFQNQCLLPPECDEGQFYDWSKARCEICHSTCGSCVSGGNTECTGCPQNHDLFLQGRSDSGIGRGQCLPCCNGDSNFQACCSCDNSKEGLSCFGNSSITAKKPSVSKPVTHNAKQSASDTGIAVGVSVGVVLLISLIVLALIVGLHYRRHGYFWFGQGSSHSGISAEANKIDHIAFNKDKAVIGLSSSNPAFITD